MMVKAKTVTSRSTKTEILDAYDKLKKEMGQMKKTLELKPEPEPTKKVVPKEPVPVTEAMAFTTDALIQGISSLKITIANALGDLESRLVDESRKLEAIKGEIREGRRVLKEIYDIELEAEALTDLRRKQEEEKERFEKEKVELKAQWDREKESHADSVKREAEAIKRERGWEKEEYEYQMKLKERREAESLEEDLEKKRAAFEAELQEKEKAILERDSALKDREEEIARLRKEVEQFPKSLENQLKEAQKEATRATEDRLKMDQLMLKRDMERMQEINELTSKGLQEKIKEQVARIHNLERDLKEAQGQTHRVATKAVEAVARIPFKPMRVEAKEEEE